MHEKGGMAVESVDEYSFSELSWADTRWGGRVFLEVEGYQHEGACEYRFKLWNANKSAKVKRGVLRRAPEFQGNLLAKKQLLDAFGGVWWDRILIWFSFVGEWGEDYWTICKFIILSIRGNGFLWYKEVVIEVSDRYCVKLGKANLWR